MDLKITYKGAGVMKKNIAFFTILLVVLFIGYTGAKADKTPALSECVIPNGSIGATVTGVGVDPTTNQTTEIRTQARVDNPSKNTVTWSVGGAPTSPADPISGTSGPGTLTPSSAGSGQYDMRVKYKAGGRTITVNGVVGSSTTPGICTGSGTWEAKGDKNMSLGKGNWTMP
jgi:hypothetical protein